MKLQTTTTTVLCVLCIVSIGVASGHVLHSTAVAEPGRSETSNVSEFKKDIPFKANNSELYSGPPFDSGAAPEPPIPQSYDSLAFGYVEFSPTNCSPGTPGGPPGGGGTGGGLFQQVRSQEQPVAFAPVAHDKQPKEPDIEPTPTPNPVPSACAYPPDRFAPNERISGGGSISDFVLGSRFKAQFTFPYAGQGWHLNDKGTAKAGLAHTQTGSHVVSSIQRLEDKQDGPSRSIGFLSSDNSGRLRGFCFIGDKGDYGTIIYEPKVETSSPHGHFEAAISYTNFSACLSNCGGVCPVQNPVVQCHWATGNKQFGTYGVEVDRLIPVVQIWDGAASTDNGVLASGDYNISMCVHEYYYLNVTSLCHFGPSGCWQYEQPHTDAKTRIGTPAKLHLPTRARRYWGREPGESGFIERNQHNIFYYSESGGCDNPEYGCGAFSGSWEEDPGEYKWNICSGLVSNSPCHACLFCDSDTNQPTMSGDSIAQSGPTPTIKIGCCPDVAQNQYGIPYRWRLDRSQTPQAPPLTVKVHPSQFNHGTNSLTDWNLTISYAVDVWNDALTQVVGGDVLTRDPDSFTRRNDEDSSHIDISATTMNGLSRRLFLRWLTLEDGILAFTELVYYNPLEPLFENDQCPPANRKFGRDGTFVSAYIIILIDAMSWVHGSCPANGLINIQPDPSNPARLSKAPARLIVAHELGHALGFRHVELMQGNPSSNYPPMQTKLRHYPVLFPGQCANPDPVHNHFISGFACMYNQWDRR